MDPHPDRSDYRSSTHILDGLAATVSRSSGARQGEGEDGSNDGANAVRDLAIRRTCWRRIVVETETGEEDEDGVHYGDGLGLADWMSRFN